MLLKKYHTGLVLSGGGARGFAHLGVAKALYENEIIPGIISGVSAGAIAGAFLASGMNPEEIFHLLEHKGLLNFTRIQIPKNGLLKLSGLKKHFQANIPYRNIEDLPIPLSIALTNLNTAKIEYFKKGNLADLVLASSSIPILFSPVRINDFQYVDGGILDNLPIKPIRRYCEKIIAVNIDPVYEEKHFDNIFKIATRVFHMSVEKTTRQWSKKADLLIQPPGIEHHDILRMKHGDRMFNEAYEYTRKLLIDNDL